MTDTMLPILRQMHEASDDRERARLLQRCPDLILMKYREAFERACQRVRFDLGLEYISWRRAGWHAVRDENGDLPAEHAQVRQAFAAFARAE